MLKLSEQFIVVGSLVSQDIQFLMSLRQIQLKSFSHIIVVQSVTFNIGVFIIQ